MRRNRSKIPPLISVIARTQATGCNASDIPASPCTGNNCRCRHRNCCGTRDASGCSNRAGCGNNFSPHTNTGDNFNKYGTELIGESEVVPAIAEALPKGGIAHASLLVFRRIPDYFTLGRRKSDAWVVCHADQPRGIPEVEGTGTNVCVSTHPTPQPNRITLNVPPRARLIIPEVVVVSSVRRPFLAPDAAPARSMRLRSGGGRVHGAT
jgi:hypothetical protein